MDSLFPGLASASNLHPLFVHFPIAFWLGALLFWILSVWRGREDLFSVGRWLLYLGTLCGAAAVFSGFWATSGMEHDLPGHDLVHVHRDFMIAAFILAAATTVIAFLFRAHAGPRARWLQLGLLALTTAVMTLGTDRGAMLVFRYGMGTRAQVPLPAQHQPGGHPEEEGHEAPPEEEGHEHR